MTKQLDDDHVRDFIRLFHAKYEEESIISDICGVSVYQDRFSKTYGSIGNWSFVGRDGPKGHSDLEYNQLGKRSLTPVEVLNSDQPLDVVQSFARSLKLGERNYVLSQLSERADERKIETIRFDEPSYGNFQYWCNSIKKPDHLFLPLDSEFHDTVFEWRHENSFHFNIGEVALSGPNIVRIHWVPLDSGIENGYLISSEGLTVVQKWFGDSPDPSGFDHDPKYSRFSENRPLMVYIGDEVIYDDKEDTDSFEHKVDFLYRVVLSNLMVESSHAVKLEPTKDLSFDR